MQLSGTKAASGESSIRLSRVQQDQSAQKVRSLMSNANDRAAMTRDINNIAVDNIAKSTRMKETFTDMSARGRFDVRI